MDIKDLGDRINQLRRRIAGLSLEKLAKETGVAKNAILAYEKGQGNPTVKSIAALEGKIGPLLRVAKDGDDEPREQTIIDMTPAELETLVARASKRDGSVNIEIAALKRDKKDLLAKIESLQAELNQVHPAVRKRWKKAVPEVKALCLCVLAEGPDKKSALDLLTPKKKAKVLTALRVLGLRSPEEPA